MVQNYYQNLEEEDKLEYLKNSVPRKWFQRAKERGEYQNEGEILADFDGFLETLEEVYISLLFNTHLNRRNGPRYLKKISEKTEDSPERIKDEYDLRELLFWKTHFKTNRKVSQLVKFTDEDTEELLAKVEEQKEIKDTPDEEEERLKNILAQEDEFHKALSKFGSDIWNIIGQDPAPYVARLDYPYLVIEFRSEGRTRSIFDERDGEYRQAQSTKRSAVRFDFENRLAELQGFTSLSDGSEARLKEDLETLFHGEIDLDDPIEITDEFITYMDDRMEDFDMEDHDGSSLAEHEGASTSKHSAEDVHDDDVYEQDILPRDHIQKSIDYDLDQVRFLGDNSVKINFSRNSNAIQIYRNKIIPRDRRNVAEFVFTHFRTFVEEHEEDGDEEENN